MNRRGFLKRLAGVLAAAGLPLVARPEPEPGPAPSGDVLTLDVLDRIRADLDAIGAEGMRFYYIPSDFERHLTGILPNGDVIFQGRLA